MGLPIVGFDLGFQEDLIKQVGHGILVPSQCVESLSIAVSQILMLPDQGREMGSRGIKYIRENYDLRNAIQHVTAVYEVLKNGNEIRSEQFEPLGHEGLNK